jgi:prephenate dehydrogenase
LAVALADETVDGKWAAAFGAGGLRDTTRIAASSAEMWRDICLTNREAISAALKLYADAFAEFARAIESADDPRLMELFERGRRMRERLK